MKSITCRVFLAALLLCASVQAAWTQEPAYVLTNVEYHLSGSIWPFALSEILEIKIGKTFATAEALEAYRADREKVLTNLRNLQKDSRIEAVTTQGANGTTTVVFHVYAKDSWNIVGLPYGKYDSNTGLTLALRFRDYNFLGSLQTLYVNVDYTNDQYLQNVLSAEVSFNLPLRFLDHQWKIFFSAGYSHTGYRIENWVWTSGTEHEGWVETTMAFWQPVGDNSLMLSAAGRYELEDPLDLDPWYFKTTLTAEFAFKLPLELTDRGPLSITPKAYLINFFNPMQALRNPDRIGPIPGFGISLSGGRVDWVANFRQGFALSMTTVYDIHPQRSQIWDRYLDWNLAGHLAFPYVQLSARTIGFVEFDKTREDAGGGMRGIFDSRIKSSGGGALNLDAVFKVPLGPLELLGEFQTGLFCDLGLYRPKDATWSEFRFHSSAGIQFIAFPAFARSFYGRISYGVDLQSFLRDYNLTGAVSPTDDASRYELYIGLGLYY